MGEKTFFTVLVESAGPEEYFIQVFWAWAGHLGAAIERALRACGPLGVENAIASEADPYDFDALPGHVIQDEKLGVFFDETRYSFPAEQSFAPPFGIIKSCLNGEYGAELIREGFSLTRSDDGLYEVEAVVEGDKLFDTYLGLVRRLTSPIGSTSGPFVNPFRRVG